VVILVHRLRGEPLYVNADLIESIESTPDTVLTLLDGRRLLVDETPEAVVESFTVFRAKLLAVAEELRLAAERPDVPPLTLVSDPEA
jgi:flagellar protein FlbD